MGSRHHEDPNEELPDPPVEVRAFPPRPENALALYYDAGQFRWITDPEENEGLQKDPDMYRSIIISE